VEVVAVSGWRLWWFSTASVWGVLGR
jgi:hypothetical protein